MGKACKDISEAKGILDPPWEELDLGGGGAGGAVCKFAQGQER